MLQENVKVDSTISEIKIAKLVGIISFIIPLTIFIIAETFSITHGEVIGNIGHKNTVFMFLISIILDFIVIQMYSNKFLKISIVINSVLMVLSLIPASYFMIRNFICLFLIIK